ncbi:bacterio-opsin activator domain-containing protein [Halobacterium jilantaiense]|uniref:PAS domain S-box-containing protein n=1 Tax=Halobacterium jilantaiense TaxID=355548 RepID=A0A1I0Q097_9EURY|nr:bacterio-opsin activator domain-containing protein [Halobacterium jilantaiense]SEW20176.1 PAS domain S-box-containing protein [Halobacterium jilantaiense]
MTEPESVREAARAVDVDESLKERAMDEAPVGITISDPSLPDNPLVYVNDAYERLTGYSREEVIGRNCRLLQGPDTREEPVAEMRRAIDAGERVSVELRNYRKDGTEFWNRVEVAPIYEDGAVTNYVGFQTDVTRRVLAERAARERAHGLRDERATLARVLDRVNGLLGDVTTALVQATTREGLQRAVCRRVSSGDSYAFAWIGEYDYASEAVKPAVAVAGDGTELTDFEVSLGDDDPAVRAVETDTVQVVDASTGGGLPGVALPSRFESMAVVPLTYHDSTYGVLCICATTEAFDDHERVVLRAIGRATATGINAVESHRRVETDERTELTYDLSSATWFVTDLAAAADCDLEYVGAERTDGSLTLLFDASAFDGDPGGLADEVDGVRASSLVADHSNGTLLAFEVLDSSLVAALAERGVDVDAIEATPDDAELVLDAPGDADPRSLTDVVEDRCPGAELAAIQEHASPPSSERAALASVADDLTERQRVVLKRAYAAGFFDSTRDVSGAELADSMGLSPSTFHQHRRAALRKLVGAAIECDDLDDTLT